MTTDDWGEPSECDICGARWADGESCKAECACPDCDKDWALCRCRETDEELDARDERRGIL